MSGQQANDRPVWQLFRVMREELGISQTEMSLRVGITQSALSRWERSGRGLTEEVVAGMGKWLEDRMGDRAQKLTAVESGHTNDGRACARIRKTLGMKQQKAAELAFIHRTSLSMFENGYSDLPAGDLENLVRVLERQVQEGGFEATRSSTGKTASRSAYNVNIDLASVEYLFGEAKHERLRKLESQLETYGDPVFRLKIAEEQIERDKVAIKELTDIRLAEKQTLARVDAENSDHKRHKELLGNFAAAQQSLITYQDEKILALEASASRDFSRGLRLVAEIETDIAKARQKVTESHQAIITELEKKNAGINRTQ